MDRQHFQYFPYAASALAGLAVCLAIALATGRREAWDSGVYFTIGIPVMCALIFAISWRFPARAWRWTLSMTLGQSVAMTIAGGSLSLWPLSLVAMAVLSVPQLAAGFIATRMAQRSGRA